MAEGGVGRVVPRNPHEQSRNSGPQAEGHRWVFTWAADGEVFKRDEILAFHDANGGPSVKQGSPFYPTP